MRLIGLFIAIALAATVGLAVLKFVGKEDTPTQNADVVVDPSAPNIQAEKVEVLVATREIPVGTELTADMIDRQPWPKHLVLDQFIVAGEGDPGVVGMVTRSHFYSREPIIKSKIANPNDPSFLAAALPQGMRVATLATDAVAGVAGFVFPGDRVDVLFTHDKPVSEDEARKMRSMGLIQRADKMTEVLLVNVRVLAADQRSTSNTGEKLVVPTNVSIEVTPEEAQKLRLAEKSGTLSLALRSIKDKDGKEIAAPTLPKDISQIAVEESAAGRSIFVVRGVKVEELQDILKPEEEPAAEEGGKS